MTAAKKPAPTRTVATATKKTARKAPAKKIEPKEPEKPRLTIFYDADPNAAEYLFWAPGDTGREWIFPKTFWQKLFRRPGTTIQIPPGPATPLFRVNVAEDKMYQYDNMQVTVVPKPPADPEVVE
jgi:hypothetical protein